ncbi:MAG: NAD(P)/FAD-dependent oxidoreductase [Pseudomonadota bacterium]
MGTEQVETLVVGAGQAGLAMSEHLSRNGLDHLVLERHRIAERWRSERWDSLVANGPAWHDRFPTMAFESVGPNEFASREQVVDYFEKFAQQIDAPIRSGVSVEAVVREPGTRRFRVSTSDGEIAAQNIVVATGPFQRPLIPAIVPSSDRLAQLHSSQYRSPDQLPKGGVVVVGSGSSGAQIADELQRSGRDVYLSIGPHHRPPRSYRGRDYCWWLGVLGKWDAAALEPGLQHVTISVSGARGGFTVDFRALAQQGVTLVGMTDAYSDGVLTFAPDLRQSIANGDANYLSVLDEADAYAERHGLDLPPEDEARVVRPDPACLTDPIFKLDLAAVGVTSIIWATGYGYDFGWLKVDAFDTNGRPQHQRGVSTEPGLYFVGLPWLSRRGSSFIWGVWHDASYIADQIAIQRGHATFDPAAGW